MENLNLQGRVSYTTLVNDTVSSCEITEEFNLPDYVPEIRKMLTVKTGVLPEGKYIMDKGNASQLDFSGTVTYLVIYTDDEGNLCSTPLSSQYESSVQLNTRPDIVFIDTVADNTALRVNAPRKLTIKTRLKSKILGYGKTTYEESITPKSTADEMYLQRASEKINTVEISQVSLQNIRISDKLDMQGYKNAKPIWCDAVAVINDCKAKNGSVSVRGSGSVKCVCVVNGETVCLNKDISIVEEIEAEKCRENDFVSVNPRCISLSISNELNEDESQLFFDLNVEIEGAVYSNKEESVTVDCYSTKHETEASYKIIDTYSAVKSQNANFTVSEAVKRKNNDELDIVDIIATPVFEKAEFKGSRAVFSGKLNACVIAMSQKDGEKEYISENYELPIKFEDDLKSYFAECISRCDFTVGKISGKYDEERFIINGDIFVSYDTVEKSKHKVLDTAILKKDKEIKNDLACVRVCFPTEDDTLWEIAKKYHTTVAKITEQNDLDTQTEFYKKKLII
ncbi:MAG: LysM peptidoglycan-binding domain-containing protein [Clostridia bacterium]|nr:LysM peptidoglycan-binding domain-containing protein [Clostridia bacterium]